MTILLEATLLLLGAFALAKIAAALRLPPLLGMLGAGVLLRALNLGLPPATVTLTTVSTEVRLGILALVLLRAGLGLELTNVRKTGGLALRLGSLPLLGDILFVAAGAHLLLGFSLPAALVMGTLLGAISPAIVIPALLSLLQTRRGKARELLEALLLGATLDNTFAVVLLGLAVDMAVSAQLPLGAHLLLLPLKIGGGALAGLLLGGVILGLHKLGLLRAPWRGTLLLGVGAGGMIVLGHVLPISFVIGIIVGGSVIRTRSPELAHRLSPQLQTLWGVAQYGLFGLIGYAVDLGPLSSVGWSVVAIVLAGQGGRALFTSVATLGEKLSPKERMACALSYIPKATIQAAFAAFPLDRGMEEGPLLMGAAIVAILLTAPPGVLAIAKGVDRLLPKPHSPP